MALEVGVACMFHGFCPLALHGVVLSTSSSANGRTSQRHDGRWAPWGPRALRVVNAWHDMQRLPPRCIQQQTHMYSIGTGRAYGIYPQHRQSVSLDIGRALQSTPYRILGSCELLSPPTSWGDSMKQSDDPASHILPLHPQARLTRTQRKILDVRNAIYFQPQPESKT